MDYRNYSKLSPNDYLFGSNEKRRDPVFDPSRRISLGADLGVGSDCGRVDFKGTMRASLKNLLNSEYFGDMGRDIVAGSPMLLTCYFSPTWCAILKNTKISANFLANMRLDQCALIDKYVDSRTEVFYQERQQCIRGAIKRHGGNMEAAMKECGNSSVFDFNINDWSGKNGKVGQNKLLESSAKWAGFEGKAANNIVNLAKSLVGDTLVTKGRISIDYGPKKIALTPRNYYRSVKGETQRKIEKLLEKIEREIDRFPIDKIVTEKELLAISGSKDYMLVDKQTMRSLYYLPYRAQEKAIDKLSEAIGFNRFSNEMDQTLDLLHVASQNVNLPKEQLQNIRYKSYALDQSVKRTIDLHKQKNIPLNKVLSKINAEGGKYISEEKKKILIHHIDKRNNKRSDSIYFDCALPEWCEGQ